MELTALADPRLLGGFCLALGLVVGSFLNVVVHRLPRGESLSLPRSRCPGCGRPIAAYDNVPVLSYLWLRGRCRHCAERISPRYPALELLTGLLFLGIGLAYGPTLEALLWMAFTASLVAAAAIDFDHHILPDEITLGGLALGLLVMPGLRALQGGSWSAALGEAALGALLGGGMLWIVGFGHARLSVALGRRFEHWPGEGEELPGPGSLDYWTWFPGLGFGDVKLLAMIGAFLGPFGAVQTLLLAALAGLVLGLGWALVARSFAAPFGFGPAIAFAAILGVLVPGLSLLP